MAEQYSPLAGVADRLAQVTGAAGGAIAMAEAPFLTQLDLRMDPDGPAAAAVGEELGLALPVQPCTSARSGDVDVLWLGPDEWLVVAPPGGAARLTGRLRSAAGFAHVSIVDVSAHRTTLRLSGHRIRDLLALGCAVDLHPSTFGPGGCVQTVLAHTPVLLLRRDPGFWALVRASFATHLADWLVDASVEYTG